MFRSRFLWLVSLVALGLAVPRAAGAQPTTRLQSVAASGTIAANGESVTLSNTAGLAGVTVQTLDTYSGTLELQCATDAAQTSFDADDEVLLTLMGSTTSSTNITDAVGIYQGNISGCTAVKLIATAGFAATDVAVRIVAITPGGGGVFVQAIRRDTTPSSSAGTAGDYTALNADANGRLYTNTVLYDAAGAALTPATDKAEDAAHTTGDTGPVMLAKRTDVAAVSSGTDGDYSTVNVDSLGAVWTRRLDPCSGVAKTHIPINISTATTTEITAALAGASNHYYICSIDLVTAAANNVALVDDDSDGCGTVTSGLAGGTTAASGWNFGANGGLTKGNGDSMVFKTGGTNRVVCIVTSAATQLSGSMQVVAAP